MTAYQNMATLYDALMDDVDYEGWAEHYIRLLDLQPGERVAELGCGTGNVTLPLVRKGFDVQATDLSPDMLALAQQKARKNGLRVLFAVQDMTRFALPRRVNAIFCACDGLNYLTSLKQVRACFECVLKSLKPGGVFAFDISAPAKLNAMAGQMYGEDREDVTYLWMNEKHEKEDLLEMNLSFFVRQENGFYRRFSERHLQRIHAPEELLKLLRDCGFTDIAAYSGFSMEPFTEKDERIHFVAHKPYLKDTEGLF